MATYVTEKIQRLLKSAP